MNIIKPRLEFPSKLVLGFDFGSLSLGLMGPVRGYKKRKRVDKKGEELASASGSPRKEGPLDWWYEISRRINGIQSPSKGLDKFRMIFKISRKTFNHVCSLVEEEMTAKSRGYIFLDGKPLSLQDQVAVALRRLGSGDSLVTVADSFGLNHSTVSQVTWRFVEAMEERGLVHLRWPSESDMKEVKSKYEKMQGLPNCCGVVDTTHITMLLSSSDPEYNTWLDRRKKHSMVLQAIVDPQMRFRDIVTGWPGKLDDSVVFQSSNFCKLCDTGERLNGAKLQLSEGSEVGEYIIGDLGYPLLPYLITPYSGTELSDVRAVEFNKRHFATQMVAHRAFMRLKETWKIISGFMWRPDRNRLPRIILTCCLLHNIAIDLEDEEPDPSSLPNEHDPGYRLQTCPSVDMKGVTLRDKLSCYLSEKLPP